MRRDGVADFDFGDKLTVHCIYRAVQTHWAEEAWNTTKCPGDPPEVIKSREPTAVFRTKYPPSKQ